MTARARILGAALACAIAAAGLACKGDRAGGAPGTAVDTDVMAYLSEARALHHEADVDEEAGDAKGALAAIDRLLAAAKPHPGERVPEVEEVLADAYARAADMRVRAGDLDGAAANVNDGLAHVPAPTYFRGHLLEVEGLVDEARAARFVDAGERDEAEAARGRAVRAFDQAVKVQSSVIERLGADGGRDGGS